MTHAARQAVFHETDIPKGNILHTETAEKEMAKITTASITAPDDFDGRVEPTSQECNTSNKYIFQCMLR